MNVDTVGWPERITVDPDVCNGRPTIRGKRIAVQTVLDYLGAGDEPEEILRNYPTLEMDDIVASIKVAAHVLGSRDPLERE